MAKTRVSELAKEYGITSKEALEKLNAIGEFAKTAPVLNSLHAESAVVRDVTVWRQTPRGAHPTQLAGAAD